MISSLYFKDKSLFYFYLINLSTLSSEQLIEIKTQLREIKENQLPKLTEAIEFAKKALEPSVFIDNGPKDFLSFIFSNLPSDKKEVINQFKIDRQNNVLSIFFNLKDFSQKETELNKYFSSNQWKTKDEAQKNQILKQIFEDLEITPQISEYIYQCIKYESETLIDPFFSKLSQAVISKDEGKVKQLISENQLNIKDGSGIFSIEYARSDIRPILLEHLDDYSKLIHRHLSPFNNIVELSNYENDGHYAESSEFVMNHIMNSMTKGAPLVDITSEDKEILTNILEKKMDVSYITQGLLVMLHAPLLLMVIKKLII